MKAIEAYRAYGGKRTNFIPLAIRVNGVQVTRAYRRLGAYAAISEPFNTVYFQSADGIRTLAVKDNEEVTLGEW